MPRRPAGLVLLTLALAAAGGTLWPARHMSALSANRRLRKPIRATSNDIAITPRCFSLTPGAARAAPDPIRIDEDRPNPSLIGRCELLIEGGEWISNGDVTGGPQYYRMELKDWDSRVEG